LAAATVGRVLGDSCRVGVLEPPNDNAISSGIAGVPSLHRLLRLLRIDETTLMRATQATFRLGTEFRDWSTLGARYFHGFGSTGAKLDAVAFQHHWLRLTTAGVDTAFEEFSMAAQAARLGRFATPLADHRSVLSLYSYAWHFDAGLLAAWLRDSAVKDGVSALVSAVERVELGADGSIRALHLENGSRLEADLFIDCGGTLGPALGVELDDWSACLPCDRMQTLRCPADEALPPYSEARASAHGWQFHVPLQHCTVRGHVYSSEFVDDDAVTAALLGAAPGTVADVPRAQRLLRGRPKQFWLHNCLLLPGDALDPLESTALHLAQTGISRFLAFLPAQLPGPAEAAEYNRLTAEEYDRIRDLLVLHYHATTRADSPFWNRCRALPKPESLAHRLALFADSGRITIGEEEHCGIDGWLSVLLGQGVRPRSYDPLAEITALAQTRGALAHLSAEMRARAATLPLHREFIAMRGATAPQLSVHA
jgi:tryptophan halogenase